MARPHQLRELGRVHRRCVDAGRDELVRQHVGRLFRVGAGSDDVGPELVETAGHEHVGVVEREGVGEAGDPGSRELADLAAQALDQVIRRVNGDEIGLGEVTVVLRLFLRTHRRRVFVAGIEVQCLLIDRAALFVDADLARDLALDSLRSEAERVHVLQLGARAKFVDALGTNRHIDVETHRALVELRVGQPELDHRLPQQLEEPLRRLRVTQIGLGDDLDERRAAAVEVDQRRRRTVEPARRRNVHVLRRILLEVRARDPDRDRPSAVGTASFPSEHSGSSYWLIW